MPIQPQEQPFEDPHRRHSYIPPSRVKDATRVIQIAGKKRIRRRHLAKPKGEAQSPSEDSSAVQAKAKRGAQRRPNSGKSAINNQQSTINNFDWTHPKREAARLVAQDELTIEAIAHTLNVSKSTVEKWKANPEFIDKVAEEVERLSEKTAKAATKAYRKGIERRLKWFEDILATIEDFTAEDLARMKNNPISTYNLALRLHSMIAPPLRRKALEETEEDEPTIDDNALEAIAQILAKTP